MEPFEEIPKDIAILIVDDVASARSIVTRLLKGLGFSNITESGEGGKAIEVAQSNDFDLVITDLHLKDMLGTEMMDKIRADPKNGDLPFVVMTSDMSREAFEKVKKKLSITYMLKPFNKVRLSEKMTEVLVPPDDGF